MYVLGVDLGTTSTKAVLFDREGRACGTHYVDYPLHTSASGAAEQDPDQILEAALSAIETTVKTHGACGKVAAVSFSVAHHGLVALDADDKPLTQLMTWADTRCLAQADALKASPQGDALYQATGTPLHPMSVLPKIVWLRDEFPALFARTKRFVAAKEYLLHHLFGDWVIDHSVASTTGLFNIHTRRWEQAALDWAGITADQLPTPVPVDHALSGLSPAMAERLGLAVDTPFVMGGGDGVLSNLGLNVVEPGVVAVSIGTSGAVRTTARIAAPEPQGRLFCYILDEKHWTIGGAASSGGVILRWMRDQLCAEDQAEATRRGCDPYAVMCDHAAGIVPGAEGLLFLPYLSGERAPLWDATMRGSFIGLSLAHTRPHMIRAVMEGILFNLRAILVLVENMMGPSTKIQASGGFARSPLWCQMMADVFNRPVFIPDAFESPSLGAAVIAMRHLGWIDDIAAVSRFIGTGVNYQPNPQAAATYDRLFPLFSELSHSLRPACAALRPFAQKDNAS